ncbi:hypothetical protein GVN16_03600 [Emticicia sp. CRIBPO]|uniref:TauD/TfdA family dioxygenase n=1 Tax=Emticicia sp. CRIBPO TaxID=2683258 RepID=UPI001412F61A|nr:TauD/TfdA family dioxygenase [Emticicia sp. CRIBPO]NBA84826.1 hypothetical protein [Emticicia sp. CRIBPO]
MVTLDMQCFPGVFSPEPDEAEMVEFREKLFGLISSYHYCVLKTGDLHYGNEIYRLIFDRLFESLSQDSSGTKELQVLISKGGTNATSYANSSVAFNFHNDGLHVLIEVPQIMGLACVKPAEIGGESILIDGESVFGAVSEDPDLMRILSTHDFCFSTTGNYGEPFVKRKILVSDNLGNFSRINYFRTIIEQGHEKSGILLTEEQVLAINKLDRILLAQMNNIKFRMESGDFLIADNRKMLHGRMPFKDFDGPSKRHMLRYWGNYKS